MRLSPETILWAVLSIGITCELTAAARGSSRRPKCRKDEFECVNKQRCIHEFDVCDGKKDCPDGSDETASQCQEFGLSCGSQPFSFKCAYGACIDKSKECDNVEYDCADNSDEAQCHKTSDTPEVTSRCQSSEFTCQSGDCVDLNDVCDGISNCKDQSDETIKQCAQMTCQPFSFQCAYGACIDWVMRCDGKKDCADGSDEADELCNKPVDTPDVNKADELNSTTDTCPFPDHPNTIYEYVCQGDGCKSLSPGTPLKKLQAVRASCPPGYAFPNKFIKKNAMICLAPPKFHATITCEKMCPPLVSEFHELECIFNGKNVPCHSPMYPGTFARLECKEFYRPLSDVVVVTQTRCQDGGTWTYSLYKCIPDNANQEENNTASTPAAHIRTPQVVRLTGRTIICLALFESGLLPRVVLRPRTTPAPTRCSLLGDPCPNHIIISVHRIRVRRQAVASRYRRIIGQLNFYTRENHPLSSPIDDANEHMKSIRSLLIELQSLFPDEDVESQENYNYYETMAEIMERRRLQLGLAQCSLIDDHTLLAIIHMLERRFN